MFYLSLPVRHIRDFFINNVSEGFLLIDIFLQYMQFHAQSLVTVFQVLVTEDWCTYKDG